jgi:hypothetical protein
VPNPPPDPPPRDPRLDDPETEKTVDALVETVRALLEEENARDQSFNVRGIGVAALVGVIGSLTITLGRNALQAGWDSPWKGIAVGLFAVALLSLVGSGISVLIRVLRPRESATLAMGEVERYQLPEYVFERKVMNQGKTLRGLIEALAIERDRVNGKSRGLQHAYWLLIIGLTAIAIQGFLLGLHDARLIGTRSTASNSAATITTKSSKRIHCGEKSGRERRQRRYSKTDSYVRGVCR